MALGVAAGPVGPKRTNREQKAFRMKPSTLDDYKRRILKVLVFIQQHLDEELPLDALAQIACFSRYHFHHVFSGMMGESVKEHVRRLRLERAAVRLKLSARSVIQIGLEAGFSAPEAFTRAFKDAYGLAPRRFRLQQRLPRTDLAAPSDVHYQRGEQTMTRFKALRKRAASMDVIIKKVEPMRVAFMRHVGPYQEVGGTWERLLPWLGKEGYIGGDSMFIGICHDDPEVAPANKVRYDACVTVDSGFVPNGEIGVQTIDGGDYARSTHFGPYGQISRTYARLLGQWLPCSGRELRACPCFEVYLNSPEHTNPEDLLTDLYAPLQRLNQNFNL
jgi:AraC family transcriptional regulator